MLRAIAYNLLASQSATADFSILATWLRGQELAQQTIHIVATDFTEVHRLNISDEGKVIK